MNERQRFHRLVPAFVPLMSLPITSRHSSHSLHSLRSAYDPATSLVPLSLTWPVPNEGKGMCDEVKRDDTRREERVESEPKESSRNLPLSSSCVIYISLLTFLLPTLVTRFGFGSLPSPYPYLMNESDEGTE